MRKVNYVSLFLFMISLIFGRDMVAFKPSNIISMGTANDSSIPCLWTLVTSVFVDVDPLAFVFNIALANYIVHKNRDVLEKAWTQKDFMIMICVSGTMATSLHLLLRIIMISITGNKNYETFEYASLNFVIMAILIGLRQQSSATVQSSSDPFAKTE